MLREDVKAQKLHPTGLCGFSFEIPERYTLSKHKGPLSIVIKESGIVLQTIAPHLLGHIVLSRGTILHRLTHRRRSRNKKVFFMHIPKTAGTSFNSFARHLYQPAEIITHIEAYDQSAFPQIAATYNFISGHLRMDTIQHYFSNSGLELYTLIREPFAHLHSHLNWLRGIGADPKSAFYKSHHGLFKNLADQFGGKSSLTGPELQHMVDELSGVLGKLLDNNQSRYFLTTDPEKVHGEDWDEIKDNLEQFTLTGTTDQYATFKGNFCAYNLFDAPKEDKPLNTSKFSQLYDHRDPAIREIVYPLVALDVQLYEHVQQRNDSATAVTL